jgi:hypothetical protein
MHFSIIVMQHSELFMHVPFDLVHEKLGADDGISVSGLVGADVSAPIVGVEVGPVAAEGALLAAEGALLAAEGALVWAFTAAIEKTASKKVTIKFMMISVLNVSECWVQSEGKSVL